VVRWSALALVVSAVALGTVACGDDESAGTETTTTATTEETTTEETTTTDSTTETSTESTSAVGRDVFLANCGSCHTFSAAGTSGAIGPNLDGIGLSSAEVAEQVRNGGGGMPAFGDQLSDDEIEQVAAYVAGSRGT